MKKNGFILFIGILIISTSCVKKETPSDILLKTIESIDTIKSIYYKQDMTRTNPRNIEEIIYRYREMYFQRLKEDSIVGAMGHWYFFNPTKDTVIYEDIYDGNKVVRKNNKDRVARVFDLNKYPEFTNRSFWGHNTPYSMQYLLKFILKNKEFYQIERLKDTVIQHTDCFVVSIRLENKEFRPGFNIILENNEGNISTTLLFISKMNFYPIRMRMENLSGDQPRNIFFTDQTYFDIKFNMIMDENIQFDTSDSSMAGFRIDEMKP